MPNRIQQPMWAPGINRNQRIAEGLRGHWPMWESDGETVMDVANGNTGTMTGMDPATDWVRWPGGAAIDFDGTDDYLILDKPVVPAVGPITMAAWIWSSDYSTAVNRYTGFLQGHGAGAARAVSFFCTFSAGVERSIGFDWHSSANTLIATTDDFGLTNSQWHHVAVTHTGSLSSADVRFYIDGLPQATSIAVDGTGVLVAPTGTWWIGRGKERSVYFTGRMSSVDAWDRILLPDEIRYLHGLGQFAITERHSSRPTAALTNAVGPGPAAVPAPYYYTTLMGG